MAEKIKKSDLASRTGDGTLESVSTIFNNNTKPVRLSRPDGVPVAEVHDRVLKKTITGSKHILRKPPAIAFSVSILEQARNSGASLVSVYDHESKLTYSTPLETFWRRGIEIERGGYEAQKYLPLGMWTILRSGEVPAEQLSFFATGASGL